MENRNIQLPLGWVALPTGKFRAVLQMCSAIHHLATDLLEEVQNWWIVRAREERNCCGFKPILAPDDEPEGDVGTPKPKRKLDSSTPALKRKQSTAITKAFVAATNKLLADGSSDPRDKRVVKMLFSEATLKAEISMRMSKQLVPKIGHRRKGFPDKTRTPAPRPHNAQRISDADMLEEVRKQSVESCRWSAKLECPKRTLLGSRRRVWNRLTKINESIGYRQFCRRTRRGKLGVERAQNRYADNITTSISQLLYIL